MAFSEKGFSLNLPTYFRYGALFLINALDKRREMNGVGIAVNLPCFQYLFP